jgi:hypothetical protein
MMASMPYTYWAVALFPSDSFYKCLCLHLQRSFWSIAHLTGFKAIPGIDYATSTIAGSAMSKLWPLQLIVISP